MINWIFKIFRREPKPEPEMWWDKDWKRVRSLYPVGRTFVYLGKTLIVAQYGYEHCGAETYRPQMVCEYVDDHGRLREWYFYVTMMPLLLKEEATPVPACQTAESLLSRACDMFAHPSSITCALASKWHDDYKRFKERALTSVWR